MKDPTHWKTLYRAAMLELDDQKIADCIKAAREALGRRFSELQFGNFGSVEEKQEIIAALASLQYWETLSGRRQSGETPLSERAREDETQEES